MTHLMFGKIHAFPARADAVDQIWLNCCIRWSFGALPCGRPALFASRTKPKFLARSGNDQERKGNEQGRCRALSRPPAAGS